jgi:hypothetical protein
MTLPSFSTLTPYIGLGGDHAEPTCARGPSSGLASDSGLQEIGNGQVAQRPWRTYADSSWAQGTLVPHAPIDGVLNPYLGQLGQVGMASENSTAGPETIWDDATWSWFTELE